jgi:hypothetical protein
MLTPELKERTPMTAPVPAAIRTLPPEKVIDRSDWEDSKTTVPLDAAINKFRPASPAFEVNVAWPVFVNVDPLAHI